MKIILFIFLLVAFQSKATNYFVAPLGNDSNNGLTIATAFETLQHAADVVAPGDTVFAMSGTYTKRLNANNVLDIFQSGTAAQWIVFKNYPGQTPVIKMYDQWSGIAVQGADYIVIDGFSVVGNNDSVTLSYAQAQQANTNNPATSGNGIGCAPEYNNNSNKPHHITICNCKVSKCGGGGIYTYNADYITIDNNVVNGCAWYSPYGNSGISLYQNWNSDSSVAIKNRVTNNTCYRNEEYIPWFVAGSITDGNGIIIDDARNTQNGSTLGAYRGRTYVANNVVFDNGGRGINCYSSDKVLVVNNTSYHNCQSPAVQDGEFTSYDTDSMYFINNIALPASGIPPIAAGSATHTTVDYNLWAANAALAAPYGTHTKTGSPGFINESANPLLADFHLSGGSSAAINSGTRYLSPAKDKDGYTRLLTDSVDIGAYEFHGILPLGITRFYGHRAGKTNVLHWEAIADNNCVKYAVERGSTPMSFQQIGTVNAGSAATYTYADDDPWPGSNNYRLKRFDRDGAFTYSNTITLRIDGNTSGLALFPNPATEVVNLTVDAAINGAASILIYDMGGKLARSATVAFANGAAVLNVKSLPHGFYRLVATQADLWLGNAVLVR